VVNKHTFDVACVTRHLVGVVQYLHGQCVRVVTHTEFTWNRRREIPVVTKLNCYIGSARVDAFSVALLAARRTNNQPTIKRLRVRGLLK